MVVRDAGNTPDAAPGLDAGVGRDGGAAVDAAVNNGSDAGVPNGVVPVFVAMGYGTRRIVSCDYGRTWAHDEEDVPNGGDDGYLVRGLGYGNGRFVAAVGGGGTQLLFTSEDGILFTRFDRGGNGFSDVAYGNGWFVAGGGHISVRSADGYTWTDQAAMGSGGILRHLTFGAYGTGRFVAVGDTGRRMNSANDAQTWGSEVAEGNGLRAVAYGAGAFVAVSDDGTTRYSLNGGDSWQAGSITGASNVRGLLHDGIRFIATTSSNTFTSDDGLAWTSNPATGGPEALAVSDDRSHYAGALGGDLYHSTDGIAFTRVNQGGQALTRVKFGWVRSSSTCPFPPPAP